jgi:hypothetical protein
VAAITKLINMEINLFENVGYRYLLLPDYKDGEGRIMQVGSHAWSDATNAFQFFLRFHETSKTYIQLNRCLSR